MYRHVTRHSVHLAGLTLRGEYYIRVETREHLYAVNIEDADGRTIASINNHRINVHDKAQPEIFKVCDVPQPQCIIGDLK